MNRYILSAIVILLSVAIAETEEVKPQARSLEMSEEYKAQRERDLNRTFDSRNTIVVDQFGGGDYTTIQEAINNASDGTTIEVNAGVYYENISFGCLSVHLKGAGMDASFITGIGTPLSIECSATKDITISGFTFNTLNNSSAEAMIRLYNMEYATITIEQCKFPNDSYEVAIRSWGNRGCCSTANYAYTLIIRNNTFNDSNNAISIEEGNYVRSMPTLYVYNNVFHDSNYGINYSSDAFNSIEISNNIFYNTEESIYIRNNSWNHWIRYNARNNGGITYDYFPLSNIEPYFFDPDNGDYRLTSDSPLIDAGAPDEIYNDLDGSRNNIGVYGGPYSWRSLGPVITNFQVTPDVVPQGETIRIQASGSAE